VLVATLGVISLLWLGRNIYMAMKDIVQDQPSAT
jgi:hypothetical protein